MTTATVAPQLHSFTQIQLLRDPVFPVGNEHDTPAVRESRRYCLLQAPSVIRLSIPYSPVILDVEQISFRRFAGSVVGVIESRQLFVILMLTIHRAAADNFGLTGHGAVDQLGDSIFDRDRMFSALDVSRVHLVVGAVLSPDAIF